MTTFRTGVEFSSNVGVLERDYQRAASASGAFGAKAQADLASVTVAQDKVALASQRVVAADSQLKASRESLNAVMASGLATQREVAAAQASFVASQERLVAAQSRQTAVLREQQAAQASAGAALRRPGGGTIGLIAGFAATEGAIKIKDAIEAGARSAADLQAVDRQLASTLASTGNVAGTSVVGIDARSEAISKQTGTSEEATRAGALLALTFTQIRNQGTGDAAIFNRAQQTAAAMAIGLHEARGGVVDFQGAVQLLGRALNDPARGLDTLRRSGVLFTAQQREQIKTLAASGHTLQAQQIILDLVNQKFANAAANYGNTAAGAYDKARESVDELERALSAPVLSTGVPVLHALTDTVEFLVAHPATLQIGELAAGLTGAAFAAATLERGVRFLRSSEWLTALGRTVFGYRSLGRAVTTLAGEEDVEAVTAGRSAAAQDGVTAALIRRTAATRAAAAATAEGAGAGAGASAVTGAEAGAGAGLLTRGLGAAGRAAGVIGLGDTAAEIIGPHLQSGGFTTAFRLGQANTLIGQLQQRVGSGGQASSQLTRANTAQQNAVVAVYNANTQSVLKAANDGRGNLDPLRQLIGQVDAAYAKYASDVQTTQTVWGTVAFGQRELTNIIGEQRQAILDADLADAHAAQNRSGRLHKALIEARTFQRQVAAGRPKAVQAVESVIGVGQAGLFDQVDPNAASARSSASSSFSSAQSSATSAQRSVLLAESRLAAVRANDKATAYQLQSAETSLANARDRSAGASDRVTAAEKKVHDAQSTSLSLAEVLKRAAGQDTNAQSLAAAAHRLVQLGVHEPVMQALLQLDQQAPGTFARVAAHLTRAGADELNRDDRIKNAARHSLDEAFAEANTKSAEVAAANAAHRAALAWRKEFAATISLTDLSHLHFPEVVAPPPGGPKTFTNPLTGQQQGAGKPLAFDDGGWVPGPYGAPRRATVHGGEYVLSRDMIAGRQPIGVGLGMAHQQTAAQQVVVHVHTAAPSYTTKHEWHNTIKAGSPKEFEAWSDRQARVRSVTP